ncbi:pentapeptide repeat-containing protein [Streptomyces adustus]|nr:pentapeptide repeat-containing protein [Streptomyces adustus]
MRALIVTGALVILGVLPWLVWRGPYVIDGEYIDRNELAKGSAALVTGLRTAVVAFTAALGAGIALLYTARTYRLTRRGQITDRFTKALERLGSPEIYVRIGGILALEQIVQDAPEQAATDAARVLGHFIRDRAPKVLDAVKPLTDEPAADVQAALAALTRTESRTHVDSREKLDFHGLHLDGADLTHADLTHVDLHGASLAGADLTGAMLTDANLSEATLTDANLSRATLTDANLSQAALAGARLAGATLTGTGLAGATLTGADLSGATLTRTILVGATLTGALLSGATLTDVNLSRATLTEASLFMATLTNARLDQATFKEADLRDADLSCSRGLTLEQVTSARTDEDTKLPATFYVSTGASVPIPRSPDGKRPPVSLVARARRNPDA